MIFYYAYTNDSGLLRVLGLLLAIPLAIIVLIEAMSISVRRWHDTNHTAWYALLSFIPYVNLIALLILLFAPSKDPNNFGRPAKGYKFKDILGLRS